MKEVGNTVGFPFTTEYDWRGVLNKEIIWRLTGGDITEPDNVKPIMRHYAEPRTFARTSMPELAHTTEPQLFEFTQETHVVGHDIQGLVGREMLRHELIVIQTWQDQATA